MAENTNVVQLMDALGKVLETRTPDVDKAFSDLANAMNSVVTKITKATEGGSTDTFFNLITDKDSKVKKFSEYLQNDMPDAFKKLSKDIEDVRDGLQKTAKSLDEIRKNAKGGSSGGKGGGGTSDCPCEKILSVINDNVNSVHQVMTSTGIKLEQDVTRVLKNINTNIRAMGIAIGRLASGGGRGGGGRGGRGGRGGGGGTPSVPTPSNSGIDVINGGIDVIDGGKSVLGGEETTVESLNKKLMSARRLYKEIKLLKWRISDADRNLLELALANLRVAEEEYEEAKRTGINVAAAEEKLNKARGASLELLDKTKAKYETILQITKEVARTVASGIFLGAFERLAGPVFNGLLNDLKEWEVDSTRMAATMTGSIHQAGEESKALVGQYRQLLQVSDEVINQTHQFPRVVRKEWVKAINKGTRSIRETRETVTSALSAAWQVGASAEATADEFQKWNMQIGMSAQGSTSLAKTMAKVAKETGVMGDHLLHAVSAAREIAQLMRDTGIYSQQTAESVVSWMASAQKFGVDKQVQNIFRAAQGGLESFNEASSETRNLLASAGQLQNVLGGNADPGEVMKGVGDAIRNAIPSGAFRKDAQGKPVGLPDLKKLSKAEISRLDLIMKRRFGMKLGEATRLLESIQDQNPEEKLSQIEMDLSNPRMTPAEKEQLELQKKQLEIAIEERKLSKNLDALGAASEALKDLPAEGADRKRVLDKIFQQNKLNESTFREGTKLLDEKLKRQGQSFNVMGKNAQQFSSAMNELLPAVRQGDDNAIQQFREMEQALANANKTADSTAKNNSNNADRMESDQQRLQNLVQNLAKPIHTMAFQAPIWTWYLISIAGGVWAIARMWQTSRLAENMKTTADTLVRTIGTKGSGWVHDPYVEAILKRIETRLNKGSIGRGGTGTTTSAEIPGKKVRGPKAELPKTKMQGSNAFMEGSGQLLAVAAGVVALGTVLILAAKAIMALTGFDAKEAKEVAWVIGVVIGAGAAALTAAAGASLVMQIAAKTINKATIGQIYWGALMLMAVLPAVLLLAGAIIGLGALLSWIVDPKWAMEVTYAVASIITSASLIALAVVGGTVALTILGAMASSAWMLVPMLALGTIALLALTPVLLGLASAIIHMAKSQVTGNITQDGTKAASDLASVLTSASLIALAVVGGTIALTALGAMSYLTWALVPAMALGTVALLALAPVLVGLASAIISMASWLTSGTITKDGKKASEDLASILTSAASIAAAVVLASASLSALSFLAPIAWYMAPLMVLGTAALIALTPAVVEMARAIIDLALQMTSGSITKDGQRAAKDLASVLESAGKIAKAVVDSRKSLDNLSTMNTWSGWFSKILGNSQEVLVTTARGIIDGIIKPIMSELPSSKEMEDTAAKLKGCITALKLLPGFLTDLSNEMNALNEAKYLNYDLSNQTARFSWWFHMIGASLSEGIFKPLMSFPSIEEVNTAVDNLSALTNSLIDLMNIMHDLSWTLQEIGNVGIDFSALESVGGVFKAGKLELLIKGQGASGFDGIDSDMQTWMDKILGVFTGARSPTVSANSGLQRIMNKGLMSSIEKPMGNVTKATGKVGYNVNRLGGTMSRLSQNSGDVPTKIDQMKETLHNDLVMISNQIGEMVNPVGSASVTPAAIATSTISNEEFDREIQTRVEQSRPSGAVSSSMEYLTAIAANTAATNESVQEAVGVLEEIKAQLSSGGSGNAQNTSPNKRARGTPNYYTWGFGRFGDTAAKQHINSGVA